MGSAERLRQRGLRSSLANALLIGAKTVMPSAVLSESTRPAFARGDQGGEHRVVRRGRGDRVGGHARERARRRRAGRPRRRRRRPGPRAIASVVGDIESDAAEGEALRRPAGWSWSSRRCRRRRARAAAAGTTAAMPARRRSGSGHGWLLVVWSTVCLLPRAGGPVVRCRGLSGLPDAVGSRLTRRCTMTSCQPCAPSGNGVSRASGWVGRCRRWPGRAACAVRASRPTATTHCRQVSSLGTAAEPGLRQGPSSTCTSTPLDAAVLRPGDAGDGDRGRRRTSRAVAGMSMRAMRLDRARRSPSRAAVQ